MNRQTFDHALRAFFRREPFRPFAIHLASGERLAVGSPDDIASRAGTAIYFVAGGDAILSDASAVVCLVGTANAATP